MEGMTVSVMSDGQFVLLMVLGGALLLLGVLWFGWVIERMEELRDELASVLSNADASGLDALDPFPDLADALLAPDGPLYPALRALGRESTDVARTILAALGLDPAEASGRDVLNSWGITGPLADACLAAAEEDRHG